MKQLEVCSPLFFRLYVLQDGRVTFAYPDGITYDGFNINEKSLRQIWESEETKTLWKDALEHNIPQCRKCPRWSYSAHPYDIVDGHEDTIKNKLLLQTKVEKERKVLCLEE
jgi:MoaA/NifB/PqqE/SkfB family radical SAM enzyme